MIEKMIDHHSGLGYETLGKGIMARDIKSATIILQQEKVIFECPYCGTTLLRSTYDKVKKLLDDDVPRGKICGKCQGIVKLKLDPKSREAIASRNTPTLR